MNPNYYTAADIYSQTHAVNTYAVINVGRRVFVFFFFFFKFKFKGGIFGEGGNGRGGGVVPHTIS